MAGVGIGGTTVGAPDRLAGAVRRRPLISLTPLIDVVFILLVFFMLASSFLEWRSIRLDAPAAAGGGTLEGAVLVEVRAGELRLSGEVVDLDGLIRRLATRHEARPGLRVLVRPAPGVAMQRAVDVLDRIAAIGLARVSLIRAGRPGRR